MNSAASPTETPRSALLGRRTRAARAPLMGLAATVLTLGVASGYAWRSPTASGQDSPQPLAPAHASVAAKTRPVVEARDGLRFVCTPTQRAALERAMSAYLAELGVAPELIVRTVSAAGTQVTYQLATEATDTDTLGLKQRAEFDIRDEHAVLPQGAGQWRTVLTVSRKEIVLALMQHGRLTEFAGRACDIEALREHVGVRRNIVAWAEQLNWDWPEGGPARWNARYWHRGTPGRTQLAQALQDALANSNRYAVGCYAATKLVIAQGVFDYYRRVRGDASRATLVEARLWADGEPLVDIEPREVWSFEHDFDATQAARAGKLLAVQRGVAARNFVPGDWAYFLNTDPDSYAKTGYEGSNAIYLGRNRFNDHYNDHNHGYSFEEKLDMVYQWRHGVFSASRDVARVRPLAAAQLAQLAQTPARGGVLLDMRMTPHLFGFETMPALVPAAGS